MLAVLFIVNGNAVTGQSDFPGGPKEPLACGGMNLRPSDYLLRCRVQLADGRQGIVQKVFASGEHGADDYGLRTDNGENLACPAFLLRVLQPPNTATPAPAPTPRPHLFAVAPKGSLQGNSIQESLGASRRSSQNKKRAFPLQTCGAV